MKVALVVVIVAVAAAIAGVVLNRVYSARERKQPSREPIEGQVSQLKSLLEQANSEAAIDRLMSQTIPGSDNQTWEDFVEAQNLHALVGDHMQVILLNVAVDELLQKYRRLHANLLLATTDSDRLSALCALDDFWGFDVKRHLNRGRIGVVPRLFDNDHVMSSEAIREQLAEVVKNYQVHLVSRVAAEEQAFWELFYLFHSIRDWLNDWAWPLPVENSYALDHKSIKWQPVDNWVELVSTYVDMPVLADFDLTGASLGKNAARVLGIRDMVVQVLEKGTRAQAKLVEAYFADDPRLITVVGEMQADIARYARTGRRPGSPTIPAVRYVGG